MLTALGNAIRASGISVLLTASIAAGAAIGRLRPAAGEMLGSQVDATLLALVTLLFFGVRLDAVVRAWGNLRFLALTALATYVFVPAIGYAIASAMLAAHPLLMVGLAIYFMSPCTDWFLGFTRLAHGNVALGAALIPINMAAQLLLYPVYLRLFAHGPVEVQAGIVGDTLLHWFLAPMAVAVLAHHGLRRLMGAERFGRLLRRADRAVPWAIALLVMEIFAANIAVILDYRAAFAWILPAVFIFFACTFLLGEGISRLGRFAYPEHALFTMSIAARNAPLMLAVTMAALPGEPLIYAALVIGMLVEFPHLAALRRVLAGQRRRADRRAAQAAGHRPGNNLTVF